MNAHLQLLNQFSVVLTPRGNRIMPYWRLSNFYFYYFALLGAIAPFMPLYMEYLGFTPARIGELLALPMLMRCLAPNLWGWLGDRSGQRLRIVRWGSGLTLAGFSLIFLRQDYGWLVLVMLLHAFFWHAILPQFEVITFAHLRTKPERYSRIRLWGSVGFIATVVWMGHLFDRHGLQGYPLLVCLIMAGIWLSSLLVPSAGSSHASAGQGAQPIGQILRRRPVLVFYLGVVLMQVSHGPYYSFLSIYLGELGYSRTVTGWLWSLGVLAEIVLFLLMPRILLRFSVRQILLASFLLASIRWLMLGVLADRLYWLLLIQLLHAATFGCFHIGAMQFVQQRFPRGRQGMGQSLYVSLSGVGAAAGALYAGYLWQPAGAFATFAVASLVAAVAFAALWAGLRKEQDENPQSELAGADI